MINFTELVDKVDQRNRQNKEAAMAQIQPFFDVMYKKAVYDREQRQQSEQAVQYGKWLGKTYGLPYQELILDDGSLAPANLQFDAMKAQFEVGKIEEGMSQFMKDNKDWIGDATVPEGSIFAKGHWFEEMQKTVAGKKEDKETLDTFLAKYPEGKEALEDREDIKDLTFAQQHEIAERYVSDRIAAQGTQAKMDYELWKQQQSMRTYIAKKEVDMAFNAAKPTTETELTQEQAKRLNKVRDYEGRGVIHSDTGRRVIVKNDGKGTVAYIKVDHKKISEVKREGRTYYGKLKKDGKWYEMSVTGDNLKMKRGGTIKDIVSPLLDSTIDYEDSLRYISERYEEQPTLPQLPATGTAVKQDESSGSESNMEVNAWLESIGAKQ